MAAVENGIHSKTEGPIAVGGGGESRDGDRGEGKGKHLPSACSYNPVSFKVSIILVFSFKLYIFDRGEGVIA